MREKRTILKENSNRDNDNDDNDEVDIKANPQHLDKSSKIPSFFRCIVNLSVPG